MHGGYRFIEVMRHAVALNASHFNTQRKVKEYIVKAYFQATLASQPKTKQKKQYENERY